MTFPSHRTGDLPLGLYCPFLTPVNRHAEEARRHTLAWAQRFGLLYGAERIRRFDGIKPALCMARTYPWCAADALDLATDWTTWLFLLDDCLDRPELAARPDDARRLLDDLRAVLQRRGTPLDPANPLAASLADLRARTRVVAVTEPLARRLFASIETWFDACQRESENRRGDVIPTPGEYLALRERSGAMNVFMDLIEVVERIELPRAARSHETVVRAKLMVNNHVCWINDLFSWEKERDLGDGHNLVSVLSHHECQSPRAAVRRVVEMCNEAVTTFLDLERRLPRFGDAVDADLRRYVANLRAWLRGYLEWSCESERYRLPDLAA